MEEKEFSYKRFMDSQQDLRKNLLKFVRKNPKSVAQLGREIKISPLTVKSFLIEEKEVDFTTLCKIDNWMKSVGI